MPNEVLAILDYEGSRAATESNVLKLRDSVLGKGDLLVATGRKGLSRGVLLVKANGGKPVVVGRDTRRDRSVISRPNLRPAEFAQ